MSKIERKNLKIFAENAANTGQFGSAQTGTKITTQDPETVQALGAWGTGWANAVIGGSKLPPMEELQATTFVSTYNLAYLFQEGIAEWNAETNYYAGSWVKSGQQIYASLVDDNLNNALTDGTKWRSGVDLSDGFDTANIPAYAAGTYSVGDLVSYEGLNWYCAVLTTSDAPSLTTKTWLPCQNLGYYTGKDEPCIGGFNELNYGNSANYSSFYRVGRYRIGSDDYFCYRLNIDGTTYADDSEGGIVLSKYKHKDRISSAGSGDSTLENYSNLFTRAYGNPNLTATIGEPQIEGTAQNGLGLTWLTTNVNSGNQSASHKHGTNIGGQGVWLTDGSSGAASAMVNTGSLANYMLATMQNQNANHYHTVAKNSWNSSQVWASDSETRPQNFSQGCWGVFILVPVADIP